MKRNLFCLFVWVNYTTRVKTRAIMNLYPAFSKGLWHRPILAIPGPGKTQAVFFCDGVICITTWRPFFSLHNPTDNCFLGPPPWGTTQRVDEIIYDGRSTYPLRTPEARTPEIAGSPLWHKGFWTPFWFPLWFGRRWKKPWVGRLTSQELMNLLLWRLPADDVMCQATECMRPRVEATNKEFLGSFVRRGFSDVAT